MHQMRRAGRGPRFLLSSSPEKPDERVHVALDLAVDATLAIVILAG
jgi:hypothetical protein